jgi:hypothetical protein
MNHEGVVVDESVLNTKQVYEVECQLFLHQGTYFNSKGFSQCRVLPTPICSITANQCFQY